MRKSFLLSTAFHLGIFLMAFVSWPQTDDLPAPPSETLPVELVSLGEFTNLSRKALEPRAEQPPKPEPPEPRVKPEPEEAAPPIPEKTPEKAISPAEQKPEPPAAAEPPPAPEPAEKKAEIPERALAKAAALEERPSPRRKPQRPKKKDTGFDPSRIAALLDKTPDQPREQKPAEPPEPPSQTARLTENAAPLTLSERDYLKAQIERCWTITAFQGAPNPAELTVKLRIYLNPDGSLAREPEVLNGGILALTNPYRRAAEDSARRAVLRCQPFQMPLDKYANWREIELTFDPTEMLGG